LVTLSCSLFAIPIFGIVCMLLLLVTVVPCFCCQHYFNIQHITIIETYPVLASSDKIIRLSSDTASINVLDPFSTGLADAVYTPGYRSCKSPLSRISTC
jgi:hypothetical protein